LVPPQMIAMWNPGSLLKPAVINSVYFVIITLRLQLKCIAPGRWLNPVILPTPESDIRIKVVGQPWQKSSRDPTEVLSCAPAHPCAVPAVPRVTGMGFQSRKFHGIQHEISTSKSSC
jgi:hypothetical protein